MSRIESKKKHIKTVHQKRKLFRAKEPLLSVFMWGINHSLNELAHVNPPVMLMPDDFKASSKVRVDNHLFNKENMPSHFKFKEYCPLVFRNLRERFHVEDQQYLNSLTKLPPIDLESSTSAKGATRRFNSWDGLFLVKTIESYQVAEVHNVIKAYHEYIVERHADTLLPQYMGMYRVTVNDAETYLIVMRNIFSPRMTIHRKYDLKGSTVDRQASDKEKSKDLPTFKDNDFVNDGVQLIVGENAKQRIMEVLKKDTTFLTDQNLMDYSMLLGIHDIEKAEIERETREREAEEGEDECFSSEEDCLGAHTNTPPESPISPGRLQYSESVENPLQDDIYGIQCAGEGKKEIYFLALIDILTHYGMKKRTAQAAKAVKHGANAEISTVKPEQYAKRFLEFIDKVLS
ncbi:DgyrCDS8902 [Dimorphilus gyrociliatus]|uniref:1-phosphatidylinositol-5-phosphate 4-kinase n=1 Tax=Dimorphilus gyrociliatus TaxID=2664684 RepID=A0A7I8VXR0_9ANNE|nr:DgyrCDS8902 [Dimorphilus gyrociliatus]